MIPYAVKSEVDSDDSDCAVGASLAVSVASRARAPPVSFHGFWRDRELGRGAFGKVFICSRDGHENSFALKAVDLRRMRLSFDVEREQRRMRREVDILRKLPPHTNIVQLMDAFEEDDWLLLVLELVGGGDLLTALTAREPSRFLEPEAAFVLRQLATGLSFLHGQGVLHRDMKLENVLVATVRREEPAVFYSVKISDFGLSKAVGSGLSEARSTVGTAPYTAPEVLNDSPHDYGSDIWCVGVILYVLLAGRFPFDAGAPTTQNEIQRAVDELEGSEAMKSVVCGLLQLERSHRLCLVSLIRHTLVQDRSACDDLESPLGERFPCSSSSPHDAPTVDKQWLPATGTMEVRPAAELVDVSCASAREPLDRAGLPEHTATPESTEVLGLDTRGGQNDQGLQPLVAEARVVGIDSWLDAVQCASLQADVMQAHVPVPNHLPHVILGRLEAIVRQRHPTVQLSVADPESAGGSRLILVGRYADCAAVQQCMCELTQEVEQPIRDEAEVLLLIRAEAAGIVKGKQGFVLKQICEQSGAKVQLLEEEVRGQRPCIVTGALASVLAAEQHIFDLVRAVPVVPPTWYTCPPPENAARPCRPVGPKGNGKNRTRETPAVLLYGPVDHLTGDLVASPVQLREEGRPIPRGHPNFLEPPSPRGRSKPRDASTHDSGSRVAEATASDVLRAVTCEPQDLSEDGEQALKRSRCDAALRPNLLRWSERVNDAADGDEALASRCRAFVRERLLQAHADGSFDNVEWDEEPVPLRESLMQDDSESLMQDEKCGESE